jgi:hypothetical protein
MWYDQTGNISAALDTIVDSTTKANKFQGVQVIEKIDSLYSLQEMLDDIKGIIRSRKSKKK